MNTNYDYIKSYILDSIKLLINDDLKTITTDTKLVGDGSLLDSMKLIELCILLEDKSLELGFEFDWTSESALSKSRSMFKSADSLIKEFIKQMEINK
jgi:acyl carrier protein